MSVVGICHPEQETQSGATKPKVERGWLIVKRIGNTHRSCETAEERDDEFLVVLIKVGLASGCELLADEATNATSLERASPPLNLLSRS